MIGSRIVSQQVPFWKNMITSLFGRRKATYSAMNIVAASTGSGVEIEWNDGEKSRFHSSWLRFCCQCEKCKQPYSGQRTIDVASLPNVLKLLNVSVSQNQQALILNWENEDHHKGVIDLQWLRAHGYSDRYLKVKDQQRVTKPLSGKQDSLPEVEYADIMKSKEGLWEMVRQLSDHGISLVKNVPLEEESMKTVGQRMGPMQNTLYGDVFQVLSTPKPINIAYSDAPLSYHMDLMYYESPPGIQLLHCMRYDPEVKGGHSLFVDGFHVVEELRKSYPDDFANLVRIPATFQKHHVERDLPVKMTYQRPHIVLNPNKQVIALFWSPAFEGPLSVPEEDVEPYFKAYRILTKLINEFPIQKRVKLEAGDLVCFNNRRMLHGREGFNLNGGIRFFMGGYVNIDDFRSTFELLSETIGTGKPCKRIGNQCFF